MAKLLSVEEEWENFKTKFNKSYDTTEEEEKHFKNFQDNYKKIDENNKKYEASEVSSKQAINQLSDLSQEELALSHGGLKSCGLKATGLKPPSS